jgi:ABC-type branched-subunit amino acid transport system ATPase component
MTSKNSGLYLDGLAMHFGGVRVFQDVTIHIPPAQVTALLGPNGAGKSTLINVVCGVYKAPSGNVFLDGELLNGIPPHETVRRGIARTYQDVRIFPYLTALENVLIAIPDQRGERLRHLFRPGSGVSAQKARHREQAMALLDEVALTDVADRMAGELSFGQQKLLSLLRAIATGARYLLLDEPAAGVEVEMVPRVTALIGKLAKEHGRAVLLVEHNVDLVREVADQAMVLQGGSIIISGTCDQVLRDERVIKEYLGRIYA